MSYGFHTMGNTCKRNPFRRNQSANLDWDSMSWLDPFQWDHRTLDNRSRANRIYTKPNYDSIVEFL